MASAIQLIKERPLIRLVLIRMLLATMLVMISASPALAAENSRFSFSAGLGKQYGGNLGVKLSPNIMGVRVNLGAGIMTMNVGLSVPFANHWEIGVHGYTLFFTNIGSGVHLNYHWNSYRKSGLILGIDVSQESYVGTENHEYEDKLKTLFAVGYQF